MPGSKKQASISRMDASKSVRSAKPMRPMPVSAFRWQATVQFAADAAADSAAPYSAENSVWVMSSAASSSAKAGSVYPRIRMGPAMPWSRSCFASDKQLTAKAAQPAARRVSATASAPWP